LTLNVDESSFSTCHLFELLLFELFVLNDDLQSIIPQVKEFCNQENFFSAKNLIGFLTIWMGYEIMTILKLHVGLTGEKSGETCN